MLPETVHIGGVDYHVKIAVETLEEHNEWGRTRFNKLEILLTDRCHIHRQAATLLHEIVHLVDHYHLQGTLEERQISALADGLFAVLRDNPDLVKYLVNPEGVS